MQSEFACHMGLRAKFFCRNCWCKGRDAEDTRTGQGVDPSDQVDDERSECGSEDSERSASELNSGGSVPESPEQSQAPSLLTAHNGPKKGKGRAKRAVESMSEMLSRVTAFIKVGLI